MAFNRTARIIGVVIVGAWWILTSPATALAHRVTIFAWVESGSVHTESKFSGGKRVKQAEVAVYDQKGQLLLQGKTDNDGSFSFAIPQQTALRVVLTASMGHQAHWDIPLNEIEPTEIEPIEIEPTEIEPAEISPGADEPPAGEPFVEPTPTASEPAGTAGVCLTAGQVEKAVSDALGRQLPQAMGELKAELRRSRNTGLMDIVGGIGYILGLAGLGAYLQYRKRGAQEQNNGK